ncbi:MAG: type pantothenate kinase [Deferribacteres bacterium]|jgi:type III pantothenate kinase|nr:putative transcriptional acitvator, Baf family [Deferribacteraceae bacterium]MDK2791690.1 type pantothenate kinase [Deferribacteres bacterium]
MIFAVDIGNTNIVVGVFKGKELVCNFRLATDTLKTTDEYAATALLLLNGQGINVKEIDSVVISSVVPQLIYTFSKMSKKYFNLEPLVIGPGVKTGLKIKLENPKEVGADRVVNAVAAIEKYGTPVIVVDFGTATTFDVVNEHSEYLGGVIYPGIKLSASILRSKTAKLPEVEIEKCHKVVGNNTINSIKSGIYFGYLAVVDGIVERILDEQFKGKKVNVIATGGLGSIFIGDSKYLKGYEPNLTLNGLRLIYEKNL